MINEQQATIVRRIFEEYLQGASPRAICGRLNKEGVVSPSGGDWGASTVYGNRQRGTGILNNDLYQGKLVWNRLRYLKDPKTGKRISRLNDASELVTVEVPELRIVDQETWDRVKRLQGEINNPTIPLRDKMRPRTLFSGLMKCGCCGAGYTIVGRSRVGCAAAREKLSCDNRLTINVADIEVAVIDALQTHLMDDDLCKEFCREYTRRMNELRKQHNASVSGYRAEAAKVERERQQIIKSITDGVPTELIRDRAIAIQKRREELEVLLAAVKEEPVLFHPNMAKRYHEEIADLVVTLRDPDRRGHAANLLRSLVDRIILTPVASEKRYEIDLVGDLAGILSIATGADNAVVAA